VYDDSCQDHILRNLKALGEEKHIPMFVLSQLNFGAYLNEPAYSATVKQLKLCLPKHLDTRKVKYSQGEADFIVFHPRLGILIGELKAVGMFHSLNNQPEAPDSVVTKRVQKAVEQLDNSKYIISEVIKDLAAGLTIRTSLFLPYVSSVQLTRVLTANPALRQVTCDIQGSQVIISTLLGILQ
jgi:hypothetical protein